MWKKFALMNVSFQSHGWSQKKCHCSHMPYTNKQFVIVGELSSISCMHSIKYLKNGLLVPQHKKHGWDSKLFGWTVSCVAGQHMHYWSEGVSWRPIMWKATPKNYLWWTQSWQMPSPILHKHQPQIELQSPNRQPPTNCQLNSNNSNKPMLNCNNNLPWSPIPTNHPHLHHHHLQCY